MVIEEHAALDVITKGGRTYAIDESQIIRGSLTTSQSCSSGGGIPAGSCNTGTASVSFHAPSALPYEKLFGAKVKLYVWYGDTSKKQVGVYNITSTERSYGVYTLSLSDNMYLLDEACYSNDTTASAQNWLAMQLGKKRVPSVIFNIICNAYSVPHWNAAKNEKAVPESGIDALSVKVPSDCCTESVKDFANYLAEYLGAIIMPDENGELHFAYMGSRTCPITIDASNIERDTYQKSPFHVSTSSWRVNHDSGIWSEWRVVGDLPDNAAPLSIVVNNNPFWQSVEDETPESMVCKRTENMLRYMWVAQGKVAYIDNVPQINPFRCTVHVPYYFRAGDRVKIIDPITSYVYHSYVTDVTWTFRGGQQISCAGEDTRTLSVSTSRNGSKKMSDYSRYLYRKSKSNTGSVEANTYTKSEIDAKDAAVKSAADKAQGTADGAASVNNTQNTQIAALQKSAHTHRNKGVLDKITEQDYADFKGAVNKAHVHENKDTLDKIDETSWLLVYGQTHVHENQSVLDKTTASYTAAEKTKLAGIAAGAEVNQNAFSTIATGSARYDATAKQSAFLIDGDGGTSVSLDTKTGRLTVSSHTHDNKAVLDQLNEEQWKFINGAANKAHVHDNKGTLDKITDVGWNTVYGNTHSHENTLLDVKNYTNYALGKSATALAASKLSTARKINTIAFDGTADIVIPRSTKCMNASSGTGGQTGYVKVATFTVNSRYTNMPTVVRYRNRHTMPVELIFRFKNQSRVDPELEFILQVVELTGYGYKEAYLYKSATSTWDLIIAKSEAWDSVQILDCQQADGVSVTFENTHVSTVPSTAIRATVYTRAMVTSTVANATTWNGLINDVDTYNSSDTWILVKKDNRIQHRYAGELDVNSAKTLTDSGWVTCPLAVTGNTTYPSSSSSIKVRKYGKLVRLEAMVKYTTVFGTGHNVATIPEGYRPSVLQREHGIISTATEKIFFDATLGVGGSLSFAPAGSGSSTFNPANSYECRMTYFID